MITKIYIGNSKLDLFADESINVVSSIADTQDITKNTTDFTKTFTVPASDTNNGIFKHYYNATIDNGFDARIKVDGRIELDGIPFKTGKWRLSKVNIKKGLPSSYTINFWGNLIDIKKKIKKDELSSLDLSTYNHNYNGANIKTGLNSSLSTGVIIYNLLVKKQYFYNSDATNNIQTATLSNIAFGGGASTGVIWNDLRPSIQLIKIIEAIETKYSITFSRDFFGRTEFTQLYLWLNKDTKDKVGGSIQVVDFDGGSSTFMNLTTNKGTYLSRNTAASNDKVWWTFTLTVTPAVGFTSVPYNIKYFLDDAETKITNLTGSASQVTTLEHTGEPVDFEVFYKIETNQEFDYTTSFTQQRHSNYTPLPATTVITTSSSNTVLSFITVSDNLPKIKTIDFLKGLFQMFKLVVIPQTDGSFFVNSLQDYYDVGTLINATTYIDFESVDVARGNILDEINFNFQEPSTILNIQFEKNNSIAYGDEETQLTDSVGEPLDGDTLEISAPFEQVVYERLNDLLDNSSTNVQYGAIVDETIAGVNPKPHIFYNINQDLSGKKLAFIDENSVRTDLGAFINTVSHIETFENQQFSTLFSSEFSTWDGNLINNTLYTNYHQEYVNNIFNIKRRNFRFTANLPLNILISLELNDILQIQQDFYRIDNFNIDLLTGKTTLNLINAFETQIGAFTPSQTDLFVDFKAQAPTIHVSFLKAFTTLKTDNGFGTAFVTVTSSGSNLIFTFTENTTAGFRDMFIQFTDDATSKTFTIYVNQTERTYAASYKFNDPRNTQLLPTILIRN